LNIMSKTKILKLINLIVDKIGIDVIIYTGLAFCVGVCGWFVACLFYGVDEYTLLIQVSSFITAFILYFFMTIFVLHKFKYSDNLYIELFQKFIIQFILVIFVILCWIFIYEFVLHWDI